MYGGCHGNDPPRYLRGYTNSPGLKMPFGSNTFRSIIWVAVMMTNQSYPNAVRQLPVEEMVRKPFQVSPAETGFDQVKSSGFGRCQCDYLT